MKTVEMLNEMSQEELVEYVLKLQESRTNGTPRKAEVLALLEEAPHSIVSMAEKLGISEKNVSSQLTYLRKDGYTIMGYTDKETGEQVRAIMS